MPVTRGLATALLALAVLGDGTVDPLGEQDAIWEALVRQAFCRASKQDDVCWLTVDGKAPPASLLRRLADLPVRPLPQPPPTSDLVFDMGPVQLISPGLAKVYAELRGARGPLFLGCTYTLRRDHQKWVVQEKLSECIIT